MSLLLLGKVASIERSVARAREEHAAAGGEFALAFTHQDAAILNILRGCEAAIDLANILIRERGLGIPQSSRGSFQLLADAGLITPELSAALQRMVGFRNVAVHQYQSLDLAIVEAVLVQGLDALLAFGRAVVVLSGQD
jgi:uncharacterized protein YutE (UPF0331/DUF86 family)